MKDFFNKTAVKIIAWIMFIVSVVVLVIGGVTEVQLGNVIAAVLAIMAAVSGLVILIAKIINGLGDK